ncbi:MAG TPA: hypothetical protein VGJ45_08070 [Pseudonocardiaceae bacterium]
MKTRYAMPPMWSWQEFLDMAQRPETIDGAGRQDDRTEFAGADWDEALRLAVDGWQVPLEQADVTVGTLRERAGIGTAVTTLEPTWDVTGSEVDMALYLAGVPECMIDAVPTQTSRRGRVVTFVVPASYESNTEHHAIINRGLALATLCTAIIEAGHGVEIWSEKAVMLGRDDDERERFVALARVISPGEPFDVGRLIFAMAHPAMLRRIWFAVTDGLDAGLAQLIHDSLYGYGPRDCYAEDLPEEITEPYLFPYLEPGDTQWDSLDSALDWCRRMFAELGLIH